MFLFLPLYTDLGLVSGDIVAGAIISHTRAARSSFRELTTEESTMRPEVHATCALAVACWQHT